VHFTRTAGPTYPYTNDYTDTWDVSTVGSYEQWARVDRLDEQRSSDAFGSGQPSPVAPSSPAPSGARTAPLVSLAAITALPSAPAATGIGFVALAGSLLYYLWPALRQGGVGLFSRVRASDLLDNPARAQIVQAVEARPGIHHQELVRLIDKGNGAVEHHLQKLVIGGLIVRHRGTGYTCYFAKGAIDRRQMAAAPLLKSPVAQGVLEAARARPGTTLSQVARELGVSVPTVHYHAQRLQAAGLIDARGGLRATADGQAAAAP
jgi:DNA-binding MarR family transcriptional regulator